MSTYKTKIEETVLNTFMHEHFGPDETDIKMISAGEVSLAGIVQTSQGLKVVRFSKHTDEGYQKDKFAYEHFRNPKVPIPHIEEIATMPDGTYYAVSELAPGITLDKLNTEELQATIPSIIQTMEAIHQTEPVGNGFGTIQLDGNGNTSSWHEALDRSLDSNYVEALNSIPMFEHDIYHRLRGKIEESYKYCPNNIRQLIHRDFGFNNTLAENGQITAVIDWDGMAYGDPLYDVAWQGFWSPGISAFREVDVVDAIKQHYINSSHLPEHFEERINCYKLLIGANCLCFFAESGQPEKYDYARRELLKVESQL